jgi:hypothetical protein
MNITSKKIMIPLAAMAIIGAGAYGLSTVSAASNPNSPQTSLVQKIADTFHLDPTKVQAVFDQNHAQNQAAHQTKYEDRLTQAVTAGQLTSSQKDQIVAENTKLKAELAAAASTPTARRAAMTQVRSEAKTWATQNNIAEKWLMGGFGGHPRGGMDAPAASPSPSPAVN